MAIHYSKTSYANILFLPTKCCSYPDNMQLPSIHFLNVPPISAVHLIKMLVEQKTHNVPLTNKWKRSVLDRLVTGSGLLATI